MPDTLCRLAVHVTGLQQPTTVDLMLPADCPVGVLLPSIVDAAVGEKVATTFIPPGSIGGFDTPVGLMFDPDRARQELTDAGWIDRDGNGIPENDRGIEFPTVELLYSTAGYHKDIALVLARMFEDTLGVETRLEGKETKVYKDDLKKKNYMLARGGWFGDYGDPTTFLSLHRTGDGNNDRGYSNPQFDEMLDAADAAGPCPARATAEALYAGEVGGPHDYLDLALDGTDGALVSDPVVAICAHGKHDQCCAVRGRAATAAIAAEFPEITWECSHLGGDRFAATMLVLPEGLCYGRVDTTDSAELVRLYLDGRLDNRHLRGRTSLPHAAQAAQYFAREKYGDDRIAGLPPLDVERTEGGIRVMLGGDAGPIEVRLHEELTEPLLSQCSAKVAGAVRVFTLAAITQG